MKEFLDSRCLQFNTPDFIRDDPVSIPHLFTMAGDIEISGFLTAIISWGQRKTIIRNSKQILKLMDYAPLEFILNATQKDMKDLSLFKHRTFNGEDLIYFIHALQTIYRDYQGLESIFTTGINQTGVKHAISNFKKLFFSLDHPERTTKHIADPLKGSAAKRINMFLRWMVRNDGNGVDFGLWKGISPSRLFCPLDIHSGRIARKFGLLDRKQNDWKAVEELTARLRVFDPGDPVRYDYALFGMGIHERF